MLERRRGRCYGAVAAIALVLLAALATASRAGVVPGDIIDRSNLDKARDFLHPGLVWCVEHGLVMEIVPYRDATRAALPSHEFPDEEGWYWNMGPKVGLTPDFFTVAELIRGGR